MTKPNEEGIRPVIFFRNTNVYGGRGCGGALRSFQRPSPPSRLASSQLVRHFLTKLCEPFTLETKAGSAGQVPAKSGYPFFDDRVVVKAKRVTLFPETIFSHIKVALPRSQVFPVYPAMQWHLKLLPSTEQVALLWQGDEEHGSMTVGKKTIVQMYLSILCLQLCLRVVEMLRLIIISRMIGCRRVWLWKKANIKYE